MDANRDSRGLGHGKGYQYPHSFPGHFIPQQYLPSEALGTQFYQPSDQGYEQAIAARLAAWREAQAGYLRDRAADAPNPATIETQTGSKTRTPDAAKAETQNAAFQRANQSLGVRRGPPAENDPFSPGEK
jgi:hypothetical protein